MLTMSEFQTILQRIDNVRTEVQALAVQLQGHLAVAESDERHRGGRVSWLQVGASWLAAAVAVTALFWRR
jgi:hypothetical protein